jgi:hypothetical protein
MLSANVYLVVREFFRVGKKIHAECIYLSSRGKISQNRVQNPC